MFTSCITFRIRATNGPNQMIQVRYNQRSNVTFHPLHAAYRYGGAKLSPDGYPPKQGTFYHKKFQKICPS